MQSSRNKFNKQPSQQFTVGKLRPSQIITTFGPGAVVDLPDDSVMIAGIDRWPVGPIIHEHRLESALGLEHFRAPSVKKFNGDVPCVRFPRYQVCSRCGLLISWRKKCPECEGDTYPARLIMICSAGHADDFPWHWWVHRGNECRQTKLRLINQGRTASLSDLIVKCDTCNRSHSLAGALGPQAMQGWQCSGTQPWLIGASDAQCSAQPRSVLRGASNVYFSSLLSALSIPPWSSDIQAAIDDHWETLRHLSEEALRAVIPSLPTLQVFKTDDVIRAIRERLSNVTTTTSLRNEEFLAFRNSGRGISDHDFQVRNEPGPTEFEAYIAHVALASRLREVRVLRGFTRIDPPDAENSAQEIAPISVLSQNWLPAIEHRGEGIFLELPPARIVSWEMRSEVRQRMIHMQQAYAAWRVQRGLPASTQPLPPRLILLHTLSHLLIKQLSLDCGYSSSSLRERIYAGSEMCGLLIYTATADSDGSLGGLVQQGRSLRLGVTFNALLESAQWCSSDPLCSEHDPVLTGRINGAACHACGLVSETSCEYSNRFLDRAFIHDLGIISGTGYFS